MLSFNKKGHEVSVRIYYSVLDKNGREIQGRMVVLDKIVGGKREIRLDDPHNELKRCLEMVEEYVVV